MARRATKLSGISRILDGPHHFANERVRLAVVAAPIANAAEPDAEVVVMPYFATPWVAAGVDSKEQSLTDRWCQRRSRILIYAFGFTRSGDL
jgi:hypothetical protein